MVKPSVNELKRLALKASLEDHKIRMSGSMLATFRVFDVPGNPTEDERSYSPAKRPPTVGSFEPQAPSNERVGRACQPDDPPSVKLR